MPPQHQVIPQRPAEQHADEAQKRVDEKKMKRGFELFAVKLKSFAAETVANLSPGCCSGDIRRYTGRFQRGATFTSIHLFILQMEVDVVREFENPVRDSATRQLLDGLPGIR